MEDNSFLYILCFCFVLFNYYVLSIYIGKMNERLGMPRYERRCVNHSFSGKLSHLYLIVQSLIHLSFIIYLFFIYHLFILSLHPLDLILHLY